MAHYTTTTATRPATARPMAGLAALMEQRVQPASRITPAKQAKIDADSAKVMAEISAREGEEAVTKQRKQELRKAHFSAFRSGGGCKADSLARLGKKQLAALDVFAQKAEAAAEAKAAANTKKLQKAAEKAAKPKPVAPEVAKIIATRNAVANFGRKVAKFVTEAKAIGGDIGSAIADLLPYHKEGKAGSVEAVELQKEINGYKQEQFDLMVKLANAAKSAGLRKVEISSGDHFIGKNLTNAMALGSLPLPFFLNGEELKALVVKSKAKSLRPGQWPDTRAIAAAVQAKLGKGKTRFLPEAEQAAAIARSENVQTALVNALVKASVIGWRELRLAKVGINAGSVEAEGLLLVYAKAERLMLTYAEAKKAAPKLDLPKLVFGE